MLTKADKSWLVRLGFAVVSDFHFFQQSISVCRSIGIALTEQQHRAALLATDTAEPINSDESIWWLWFGLGFYFVLFLTSTPVAGMCTLHMNDVILNIETLLHAP